VAADRWSCCLGDDGVRGDLAFRRGLRPVGSGLPDDVGYQVPDDPADPGAHAADQQHLQARVAGGSRRPAGRGQG